MATSQKEKSEERDRNKEIHTFAENCCLLAILLIYPMLPDPYHYIHYIKLRAQTG